MGFLHVVMTRFNLGKPHEAGWLDHRVRLFERFCLPSFRGQSCQDFVWLIFCDARTGEPWKSRLLGYESKNAKVVWCDYDGNAFETREWAGYKDAVKSLLRGEDYLITTRCDNDAAVSIDFVETIQREVSPHAGREFLNLFAGYVWYRVR